MVATCDVPQTLPAYRDLATYPTEEGRGTYLRMDFNEGPPPPLSLLSAQLALCAYGATLYPEYGPLKRVAAQTWGVNPDMILPVNGADEGIALVLRAFTDAGNAVVMPTPTFPMYRIYSEVCGTPVIGVPLGLDLQVDLDAMRAAIPTGTMLALCSPNNPTGRAIPMDMIERLLEAADGRPVLLDETYAPFCGQDGVPLLTRYPNLLLLRTLSKASGLPGLRCGFLVGDPTLIASLDGLRSPFNVNAIAATLGAQILDGDAGRAARIRDAVCGREALQQALEAMGIPTIPSDTHFFLAQLGEAAAPAAAYLRTRNILVKVLGAPLKGYLRLSVAQFEDGTRFLEAFRPWWEARS